MHAIYSRCGFNTKHALYPLGHCTFPTIWLLYPSCCSHWGIIFSSKGRPYLAAPIQLPLAVNLQVNSLLLTLNLLKFLNGLVYLPFLEQFIIIFRDIKIKIWPWSANSIGPGQAAQMRSILVARACYFRF